MKKKIIFISIISIITLAFIVAISIFFINKSNSKVVTYNDDELEVIEHKDDDSPKYFEYDYKYKTALAKTPTDGTTPNDYDSLTNISFVLYNLEHKEAFKCISTGVTKSNFIFSVEQKIANSRVVINDKAMIQTVSDGIVKIAYQKYFLDYGNKVFMRQTDKVNNLSPTFDEKEPEKLDAKEYIEKFGWIPFKSTGYIICKDTVLEASKLKYENDIYEISLTLDPNNDKAPYWYQREVARTGSAEENPIFSYINLTYKFDAKWNLISVDINEKFKIKNNLSFGSFVNCETIIKDTYSYSNVSFDEELINYYEKYNK